MARSSGPARLRRSARSDLEQLHKLANDATRLEQEKHQLENRSTTDMLTGVHNRSGFAKRVQEQYGGEWLDFPGNNLARELIFDAFAGPAFDGLSAEERDRVIALLQGATLDGGVHLVDTIAASNAGLVAELRSQYVGWDISVESRAGSSDAPGENR